MNTPKTGARLITLLFICSGLSGIVYEVIWVRLFGLVFGNTVFASSTVLSVFMTGLALGSWLFGKIVDRRKNALSIYVFLELGIGISGLLVPLLIHGTTPLYTFIYRQFHPSFYQISLVRLFISFFIMIVPCTLMGGTLPVVSGFVAGAFGGAPAQQAGRLYASNTLGAVCGCLVSGYFLIGAVGCFGTTVMAASVNLAIAAAVFLYGKRAAAVFQKKADVVEKKTHDSPLKRTQTNTVVVVYAFSGFLSLFLEVAWTRALVWVMGMDTYAFTSMLAVFLSGLALGSFLVSWFMSGRGGAILKLGVIEFLIGMSVLLSAILTKNMYGLMHGLENPFTMTTFWGSFVFLIAIAAAVMALPTLLMGMAFPLALKAGLDGGMKIGSGVGAVYAANTAGSVAGALLAGFVALPLVGVMKSVVIAACAFLLAAAVLFMAAGEYRKTAFNLPALGLAAASLLLCAGYSPSLRDAVARGLNEGEQLLYFKETVTGVVEVAESRSADYGRILRIDGRQVAADGRTDVASHKYPAHLMALLKERPKNALIIAFGAGGTAGSLLRYGDVESLDAVEICGGVIEPARRYFARMNNGVLDDPRLHLIIQDGKNFVRLTDRTYDLIYSGPIHPQSNQGSAALYTKEFFADCRKRLNPGGIQCVWLPMHVPPEDYMTIVRTFQEVYPHSSLWLTTETPNTILHSHLIGSTAPLAINYRLVDEKLRRGAVAADRLEDMTIASPSDFIGQCALNEEKLREFTKDVTRLNTDDLPVAEFFRKIGRTLYAKNRECPALLLADIVRLKENPLAYVIDVPVPEKEGLEKKLDTYFRGDSLRIQGHICTILCNVRSEEAKASGGSMYEAFKYYRDAYRNYSLALRYLPDDNFLKEYFLDASVRPSPAD